MGKFNYSEGESLELAHRRWLDSDTIQSFLASLPQQPDTFGDVYARWV
jgi:hypothetical protein